MRVFIWLLIFPLSALAKTIVVKAPSANLKDYQAFVMSSPDYEFPTQSLRRDIPSPDDRETLTELFAKAQSSFIDGSIQQAKEDFANVVALAEVDQWREEEQSVLLHSFLRLAQLSQNPDEIRDWLKKAVIWAPLGKVNSRLFPPPLMEQWQQWQTQIPTLEFSTASFATDFDFLIVNGQVTDLKHDRIVKVREGALRATFLSDTFQTVKMQLTADQLALAQPEKKPWVEGNCLKPQLHWQKAGEIAKPYFAKTCAPLKTKPKVDMELSYRNAAPTAAYEPPALPISMSENQSTATHVPFYEKTWFWVGVGAVVTGVIVVSLANHHSTNQPTSQEEF